MKARQTPTFERYPRDYAYSDGEMAVKLASVFFGEPMEWQKYVIERMLARDSKDKYAYHSFSIAVPRQNGKSWIVRARCFYGMVVSGEKILYTCQNSDTADDMFNEIASVFEDEENEELHALLAKIYRGNGKQAIYLNNGGSIRCTTRTNSRARGKSNDVLIYDEAQELTQAQQEASLPTISASKKHNTQTIYMGKPPNAECKGTVFTRMHLDIHNDKKAKFAWLEWAATEIGDITDRARWYETNPSLGQLIDETSVEGELSMTPDGFARERLGWWDNTAGELPTVIAAELWKKSTIKSIGSLYRKKTALAVRFSADGSTYALAGAKVNAKGQVAFELIQVGVASGARYNLLRRRSTAQRNQLNLPGMGRRMSTSISRKAMPA